jgi:YD repeat-containing protein
VQTTPASVEAYVRVQYASAAEDATTLRQLADRLQSAVAARRDARSVAMARSIAAYAIGIATRIETTAAYNAGARAQHHDIANRTIVVDDPPPKSRRQTYDPAGRRRRQTGAKGMQPYEYRCGDEWLTSDEMSERSGVSYQGIRQRLRRGMPTLDIIRTPSQGGGRPRKTSSPVPEAHREGATRNPFFENSVLK